MVPNHQPDENDVFGGIFSHQSWETRLGFNPLEMSTISWASHWDSTNYGYILGIGLLNGW